MGCSIYVAGPLVFCQLGRYSYGQNKFALYHLFNLNDDNELWLYLSFCMPGSMIAKTKYGWANHPTTVFSSNIHLQISQYRSNGRGNFPVVILLFPFRTSCTMVRKKYLNTILTSSWNSYFVYTHKYKINEIDLLSLNSTHALKAKFLLWFDKIWYRV